MGQMEQKKRRNIRIKRKSSPPSLKKYAEDNSAPKPALNQILNYPSLSSSDTEDNRAKNAAPNQGNKQIAHIIETAGSEMENAPKFRLTGIMSRLWQNKAVRIVVLAAAASGTVYLLAQYGISQETADQMRDYVKTLSQGTQEQLKNLGNSMSSSGSNVVNFITDAIGNTASALSPYANAGVEAAYGWKDAASAAVGNTANALSRYGNDSVEAARGLAYGLKDYASAAVGNTANALSPYANAAADAAKSRAPDVAKVGAGFIMGRLSNLKNWWSGERNPQLEEAELERRREELFRNPIH